MARAKNTRRNSKRKSASRKSEAAGGIPKWLWMLLGIAVGVVIAYSGSLLKLINNTPAKHRTETAEAREPQVHLPEAKQTAPKPAKPPEVLTLIPPEVPPKYEFYKRLPQDEVILPERDYQAIQQPKAPLQDTAKPVPRNPVSPGKGRYLVQVGSFRGKKDADRRKAELLLRGLHPRVEAVTTDSGKWYRVRLGPFQSLDKVNRIRSELHSQKIKTLLVNAGSQ